MARVCSQCCGDLGGAITLEIAQCKHSTFAFRQEAQEMLHTCFGLFLHQISVLQLRNELILHASQSKHLRVVRRLPGIGNTCPCRCVEPATSTLLTLVFSQPT